MEQLGIGHKVVTTELVLLKGVCVQYFLQTQPKDKLFVQHTPPQENLNDVHMNIHRVDPSEIQELMNQRGKRESQPLTNVDFWPVDVVNMPPIHVYTGREVGP